MKNFRYTLFGVCLAFVLVVCVAATPPKGNGWAAGNWRADKGWCIDSDGYLRPAATGTLDIGTSSYKVRNFYSSGTATLAAVSTTGTTSLGDATTDTVTVTGNTTLGTNTTLTVGSTATFNGDVALGNATTDSITVTGDTTLGTNTTLTVGGALTANGAVTLGDSTADAVAVKGTQTVYGTSMPYGATAAGTVYCLSGSVAFGDRNATKALGVIPQYADIVDVHWLVTTEFNGSGTDTLDVGYDATDPDEFVDADDGSMAGFHRIDGAATAPVAALGNQTSARTIRVKYTDQNSDSTTGAATVRVFYVIVGN